MNFSTRLMIASLKEFAASGFTVEETSAETGMSYQSVGSYARKYGIKFLRKGCAGEAPRPTERSGRMASMYKQGRTLEQIGTEYGITRERVRQIISKNHGLTGKHGGATKLAKDKRKQVYAARDARSMRRWGCPWSQYVILRDIGWPTRAYARQRINAANRGIGWELTLWQWWTIWQESGHWEERGRGRQYHMCRKLDQGPYSVDNVYIATGVQNMQDYWAHVREASAEVAA